MAKTDKAKQLYGMYRKLKVEYAQFQQDMGKMAELYFLDHWAGEQGKEEPEQKVTLPTHTNTVDMAHALLVTQSRRFHVIPVNKTAAEQAMTTEMEKWLMGVFHVNQVRGKQDAVGLAVWNALCKKLGWVRCRWDTAFAEEVPLSPDEESPPMALPTPAEQMVPPEMQAAIAPPTPSPLMRCKDLPIVLESVAPENVFARFGGPHGIQYLFYAAKRTIEDIVAEVGIGAIPRGPYLGLDWEQRAETKVDFLEYWGWNDKGELEMATMIGEATTDGSESFLKNRELHVADGYRDIPYVPFFCYRTADDRPHFMCRGLLDSTQDLVHMQEKLLTAQLHAVKMFAVMPLVANEGTGAPIEVDSTLGTVVHLGAGQSLGFPTWPGMPPDVMRLLTVAEDKVQESGFPSVSYGRGGANTSGYAVGQYQEGARTRLDLPRSNAELAITQLCQLMVGLAETFSPDAVIPVWGLHQNKSFYTQLTGKQMKGHVIEVAISSELPSDKLKNAMLGGQLKAQGILSDRTIQEKYMGIENPEDEAEQILQEQATRHPLARLIAMARVLGADQDPAAQLVHAEIVKMIGQMAGGGPPSAGAEAQANVPGAPVAGMGEAPPPAPQMMPSNMVPAIGQGQVLRQEMGLPPTNEGMM
jgi:hypothetical protein